MNHLDHLNDLKQHGRMEWIDPLRGWRGHPDEIVGALAGDGFEQCKLEIAWSRRNQTPSGGVWQGLNALTGAVASAIWVHRHDQPRALVFIDIDGDPVRA